jgi:hypothetical protein
MNGLTEEQKEAITKWAFEILRPAFDAINIIYECIRELITKLKERAIKFLEYIYSLAPRKRYKFLKRVGFSNYRIYFNRFTNFRCRNNC